MMATVLVLLMLLMILNSGCQPRAKVILLDKTQLCTVDPNVPFVPPHKGWYIENRAFKRLFQELRIE